MPEIHSLFASAVESGPLDKEGVTVFGPMAEVDAATANAIQEGPAEPAFFYLNPRATPNRRLPSRKELAMQHSRDGPLAEGDTKLPNSVSPSMTAAAKPTT